MEITSYTYLAFVGVSLVIYWFLPKKLQWGLLLLDSLIFYFANAGAWTFLWVLCSALSVWAASVLFERRPEHKKPVLILTLALNVGILALLKYANMFIGTFNAWTGLSVGAVGLAAPMAVSYYTLQIVSYLIDNYRNGGGLKSEKNPLKLLLYTCYFPLMVSGPICRYSEVGGQLFEEHRFDYDRVVSGMRRVLWGLAKKVVVADHLAMLVEAMFANTDLYSGPWVLISALMFVAELYFDFSGCMDIVIGVSKCFGILLPENFRAPLLSKTVQEFWTRWHITLGAWLKDYVMYPISRTRAFSRWSRACKKRWGRSGQKLPYYAAMFVVWSLMGIWHGSSWKYMIGMGWFFWTVIVLGQALEPLSKKGKALLHISDENALWQAFQVCRTTVLFAIGNIAFRASSLAQTFYMVKRSFVWTGFLEQILQLNDIVSGFGGKEVLLVVVLLGSFQIVSDVWTQRRKEPQELIVSRPLPIRWAVYLVLLFCVMFYREETAPFVYFQF